jgi:hypothetical protein
VIKYLYAYDVYPRRAGFVAVRGIEHNAVRGIEHNKHVGSGYHGAEVPPCLRAYP